MPAQINEFSPQKKFLLKAFGPELGKELYEIGIGLPEEGRPDYFSQLVGGLHSIVSGQPKISMKYNSPPVDVETFLRDPFYLNLDAEIYPTIIPDLIRINSGNYVEIVLTGGIGSAKTTIALWSNAYQLYLLSLMENPHEQFGLDRSSEIEIIFQSITATLAHSVDYSRFKSLIGSSPYFSKYFPFDPALKSEMHFPNRIIVKPVSGSNLATIGQNVIGGLIDELNYMAVVESSKRSVDIGTYDQAVEVYNSIARRRKSRYMKQGRMPGLLCLVSSKRYPGQFTDTKIEEAKTDPTIYVYDKRVWDIKPDSFSKTKFSVFIGDEFRRPRILEDKEKVPSKDKDLLVEIPEDFRIDFQKDIVNALREMAGVSHLSKSPFFTNPEALARMLDKKQPSIFNREWVDFVDTQLEIITKSIKNPKLPRYVHIDLGITGDSAGMALGYVPSFVAVNRGGISEMMPLITMDGVLEVRPPRGGEILFWKIRRILYVLKGMGVNVKWVSYDSFQSVDSMQLLKQKGFVVGPLSLDKTMVPYDFFKSACYDERIVCPHHPKLHAELKNLQVDLKKGKVDHLPGESKDLADAVGGVVYGLTVRRETWLSHEVPISESVKQAIQREKDRMKKSETTPEKAEED